MRKMLLLTALTGWSLGVLAQTSLDDFKKSVRCSAGYYMAYPGPTQHAYSAPPPGKKPFYISHYGRYGSRYDDQPDTYDTAYQILAAADSVGKLTDLGRDVLRRLGIIRRDAIDQWGELTELGAIQHQQIITRMVSRFPDVFQDECTVDARSTTAPYCILSMEHALTQLSRINPKLKIHHNATQRDMPYLDQKDKALEVSRMDSAAQEAYNRFLLKYQKDQRLTAALFNDTAYIRQHVDCTLLNKSIFKIASNIQNTEIRRDITLYDLFSDEELYRNWKRENAWWYISYGGASVNGGLQPYTQRNLLRKFIEHADSCITLKRPSVQLRYGQGNVVMSLACLLDLNGYGLVTDDLESLDRKGWANYKISPMAANIQFVFYRENANDKDVLFKVLLNEKEATLPLKGNLAPYYYWKDFREYFSDKLDKYEEARQSGSRQ